MNDSSKIEKKLFPLESNPALINDYVRNLGFDTNVFDFVDVYSTESWALDMIAQPVAAVLLLYPLTEVQREYAKQDKVESMNDANAAEVWFVKQRISNACGTIGLLHSLLNVPEGVRSAAIDSDSWLGQYYKCCPIQCSPITKAERLEADSTIETLHDAATSNPMNQTSRGSLGDKVQAHFLSLVHVNGGLFELDGRKEGPIRHGNTNERNLLKDACRVVEVFMKRDPKELRFSILALAPKAQSKQR